MAHLAADRINRHGFCLDKLVDVCPFASTTLAWLRCHQQNADSSVLSGTAIQPCGHSDRQPARLRKVNAAAVSSAGHSQPPSGY
jgi:hypothetical protein